MTKIWRLMACTAVGLSVLGLQAKAQVEAEPHEAIDLGVTLRVESTDNRDATPSDEESNVDYYITPRLHAYFTTDRTVLDLFYAPSFRYRSDPADSQNADELLHDLGLRIDHTATERTKLRLLENFALQDDPSIEDGAVVRSDRSYILNKIELGARHDFKPSASYADVVALHEFKAYDDSEVADESDEDRTEANLVLNRSLSRQMAVYGMGGIAIHGFESAKSIDRDFDVIKGILGVERTFSAELRSSVEAGVQSVEYSDESLDAEVFPYGKLNATYAAGVARFDGTVTHGMRDSDVYPFASQEYTQFTVGTEIDPTSPLSFGVDLTLRQSEYTEEARPDSAAVIAGPTSGDETTMVLAARATWAINEAARVVVRHTYEDVDSDVDQDFTKNTSGLELHLDF